MAKLEPHDWVIVGAGAAGLASVLALTGRLPGHDPVAGSILLLERATAGHGSSLHNPGRGQGGFHYPDVATAEALQDLLAHQPCSSASIRVVWSTSPSSGDAKRATTATSRSCAQHLAPFLRARTDARPLASIAKLASMMRSTPLVLCSSNRQPRAEA